MPGTNCPSTLTPHPLTPPNLGSPPCAKKVKQRTWLNQSRAKEFTIFPNTLTAIPTLPSQCLYVTKDKTFTPTKSVINFKKLHIIVYHHSWTFVPIPLTAVGIFQYFQLEYPRAQDTGVYFHSLISHHPHTLHIPKSKSTGQHPTLTM